MIYSMWDTRWDIPWHVPWVLRGYPKEDCPSYPMGHAIKYTMVYDFSMNYPIEYHGISWDPPWSTTGYPIVCPMMEAGSALLL